MNNFETYASSSYNILEALKLIICSLLRPKSGGDAESENGHEFFSFLHPRLYNIIL